MEAALLLGTGAVNRRRVLSGGGGEDVGVGVEIGFSREGLL